MVTPINKNTKDLDFSFSFNNDKIDGTLNQFDIPSLNKIKRSNEEAVAMIQNQSFPKSMLTSIHNEKNYQKSIFQKYECSSQKKNQSLTMTKEKCVKLDLLQRAQDPHNKTLNVSPIQASKNRKEKARELIEKVVFEKCEDCGKKGKSCICEINPLIIIHCEFSQERGPRLYSY